VAHRKGNESDNAHGDGINEAVYAAMRLRKHRPRDFDAVELAAQFPGQPICVQFTMAVQDDEDVNEVADTVVKLEGVGLQTDEHEISERTGYKLTRIKLDPLTGQGDPAQKADQHIDRSDVNSAVRNRLLNRLHTPVAAALIDLDPLRNRLAVIGKITDAIEQRRQLLALEGDLNTLQANVLADSSLTAAIEGYIAGELGQAVCNRGEQPRDSLGRWVDENGGGLSIDDNLQRGKKAMNRALRQKADVQKAMHRKGVGQIDFEWGRPGTPAPNKSGATHADGYGVSHIVAKHGEATALNLPEVIARGKITPHQEEDRLYITHGGQQAILQRKNSESAYVVTSFEPLKS
jgi:hypothetical protein